MREPTPFWRRHSLRVMQNSLDLGGAYGATLERIKAQGEKKARLGMAVLMWISHSRRPLQVDEIRHALAVRIGSNDLDLDNIPGISTMLACCQGLATIDKSTSSVRLIHFTLQEHLRTHPGIFAGAHSTIAETCLTYLNSQHVKDLSVSPPRNQRGLPLLEYCSLYWGTHMRSEPSDGAKKFALQFLDHFDSHISAEFLWKLMTKQNPAFAGSRTSTLTRFSPLHYISYLGIAQVVNTLLEMNKWDVNQSDSAGITPLIWAASCGHEEVVELLLQQNDIQPDLPDTNGGRTALSWAAGNGHEGVVRIFLGPRFINLGRIGRWCGTTLGVEGLLFGRKYVDPDSPSTSGRTPLSFAAENGHEGVVKLLLERQDVNPDSSSEFGRTPLIWAATYGHEGVVKILLERKDVNPDRSTIFGKTSLANAAHSGHEGIMRMLLERDEVNPDGLDTRYFQTPLSWAAENGHEGAVKILLGQRNVKPDRSDKFGRTPLSWAAENGYEGVVRTLLERNDIDPNSSSKSGQTPLMLAAKNGHHRVVELLQPKIPRLEGNWLPARFHLVPQKPPVVSMGSVTRI